MTRIASLSLVGFLAAFSPALAQQTVDENILSHRIIEGWTKADGSHVAGLELTLAPGWKTYWRVPGDAGIPPRFLWNGAHNVRGVNIDWPAPLVFWQYGMRSVGYENTVVLPLTVHPKNTGKDIRLNGHMDLGICSDVCVPARIDLNATLSATANSRPAPLVAALASLPYSAQEAGVTSATCRITPAEDGMTVEARIALPKTGSSEEAVIEPSSANVWVSDAKTVRNGGTLTVSAQMVPTGSAPMVVNRSNIRITVIGGNYAVDIQGCTG